MKASYDRQEHLEQLHSKRRDATQHKAEASILRLARAGKAVNFNSVASESGLSKATFYNNPDIRASIEKLRHTQSQLPTPAAVKLEMCEQSKDAVIASLKRKIKTLQEENQRLKEQIKMNYADFYEQL